MLAKWTRLCMRPHVSSGPRVPLGLKYRNMPLQPPQTPEFPKGVSYPGPTSKQS
jgi:hypothetical protein